MQSRFVRIVFFAVLVVISLTVSCRTDYGYFSTVGGRVQTDLEDLFSLMEKYKSGEHSRERFVINKQLIDLYTAADMENRKILYLTFIVEKYPGDPFNAYYLALVAQAYQKQKALRFAHYYYERAVTECEDLFFAGEYIHKYCLEELAAMSADPEEKIRFYRLLLRRIDSPSDRGEILFFLARSYEQVGEYEKAVESYKAFLLSPAVDLPGFPDTYARVKEKLKMYENSPSWVVQDLNDLVAGIRRAIDNKNTAALAAYRAKDYFFTRTWEQKNDEAPTRFPDVSMVDYIGTFLIHSDVTVAPTLDIDSSTREAFLRTENWAFRIHPTWYFYFRRVEFGPDPDINGGWEWAGIYFGEKL